MWNHVTHVLDQALDRTVNAAVNFLPGLLALVIILYDAFHKGYALAPLIMGLCRALLYCGAAAAAVGGVSSTIIIAAAALLAYVAGLTYAARQESLDRVGNLWPLAMLIAPIEKTRAEPIWRMPATDNRLRIVTTIRIVR